MGIEYTQVYISENFSTAGSTGNIYIPLNPNGSSALDTGTVFSVSYMSISSSSGISNSVPTTVGSAPTNSGLITQIYTTRPNVIPPNEALYICTGGKDSNNGSITNIPLIFINQPYLVVNTDMTGAGFFRVTIMYSMIPANNALIQNFGIQSGVISAASPQVLNPLPSNTVILKSLIIANFSPSTAYYSQLCLWNNTTSQVVDYLNAPGSVPEQTSFFYYPPTYLQSGTDLSLSIFWNGPLNYYTSYTTDIAG